MAKRPLGYVTPNENNNKKMDKSVEGYTFDISFCATECDNTFCFRNFKRINQHDKESKYPHSFSEFFGTEYCPSYLDRG